MLLLTFELAKQNSAISYSIPREMGLEFKSFTTGTKILRANEFRVDGLLCEIPGVTESRLGFAGCVGILRLGQIASLLCNFYSSVALRRIIREICRSTLKLVLKNVDFKLSPILTGQNMTDCFYSSIFVAFSCGQSMKEKHSLP